MTIPQPFTRGDYGVYGLQSSSRPFPTQLPASARIRARQGGNALLEHVALFLLIFVALVFFYGIIAIHEIPYEIAVKRNHPHQEVLHVAGWVSLFTLNVLWPFPWIWAMMYREDRGWGIETSDTGAGTSDSLGERLAAIETRLAELESAAGE